MKIFKKIIIFLILSIPVIVWSYMNYMKVQEYNSMGEQLQYSNEVYATTEFDLIELPIEEQERLRNNFNIRVIDKEFLNRTIDNFDINEDGFYALDLTIFAPDEGNVVSIYSPQGEFITTFMLGSAEFSLEFNDNTLNLFYTRSDTVISIDYTKNLLKFYSCSDSPYYEQLRKTKQIVNDYTYELQYKNNFILSKKTRFVKIDKNGNETVLYDY